LRDWTLAKDCVWSGPDWYEFKPRLASIPQHKNLWGLFRVTLSIPDVGITELIEYLHFLKTATTIDHEERKEKTRLLYTELSKEIGSKMTSEQAKFIK
jgi:hypothetical protein